MNRYILAIDQGTTSSRAIVFDQNAKIAGLGQQAFQQFYPQDGWVEHDPEEIWQTTLASCKTAIQKAGLQPADITTAGITNQRETTIVWDKNTDKPVYNAIVWQDRRTAQFCKKLKAQGMESSVQEKTGLLLDPYFSASKISWILDNVPDARSNAEKGTLVFGTVDSYLLWRLSGGKRHATDVTNASRTLLYNIHEQCWDEDLLSLFGIPKSMMPEVLDCAAEFSTIDKDLLGSPIPVQGVAGDQQAAAFGQCCFSPGMAKSTYGTGCFLLLNTGNEAIQSNNRLLTTIAYRLENKCHYALEGSIFMAGATMQWIRDGIKLIDDTSESETLARQTGEDLSVYLVPAFTGLGAPYWDPDARGAIFGLTRDTGIREIVTAALLSVAYQSRDLQQALIADGATLTSMRVDGGMAANSYLMQFLADILDCRIDRPAILETTALGAAFLAGLQAGIFNSLDDIAGTWKADTTFQSARDADWRERRYAGWLDAIGRTRSRED